MDHSQLTAQAVTAHFESIGNPERAGQMQRFFKTAPGEYAEGDLFLGISVPDIRAYEKTHRPWRVEILALLLQQPYHEVRHLALIGMTELYRRARSEAVREGLLASYLSHTTMINNWDLVDVSAPGIVGEYVHAHPIEGNALLDRLADSFLLWEQRIAMVANWRLIRYGEYEATIRIAERLLHHPHDLIHKAVGWMLREMGKKQERLLLAFLDKHAATMPRTALRYTIEKLPSDLRSYYLTKGK
ncbi:DNA alkylation repair protein [Porphyromonas gingivalis]|uniref:DNA alkylation repair protein n=1 Tax=Porphyromonas gingivalis TaxID=837 RepID=UPI000974F6FD|nr:DNA alkylation repair protein [Porphyromonas gingivalis]ATS07452.1 DNA alkylation repair protein [Porphyromonas gingivalis]ATS10568.1 DNA alkylation repair protein [Porphyromonas gingivalis]SJL32800.1 DNA alkylation repair enzyme [Porphyromonas gingivalis]